MTGQDNNVLRVVTVINKAVTGFKLVIISSTIICSVRLIIYCKMNYIINELLTKESFFNLRMTESFKL